MIKVKYNNEDLMRNVSFSRVGEHIVTLGGTIKANVSGFKTYRLDGKTQLGDFSDYVTVYRTLDDSIQYSNDGSVWVEPEPQPEPPEPTPVPQEPVPYEPSLEERVNDLEIAVCELADALG